MYYRIVAKNKYFSLQLDDWAVRRFFDYFYGFAGKKLPMYYGIVAKNTSYSLQLDDWVAYSFSINFTDLQGNIP
jgi:hypothetical protein